MRKLALSGLVALAAVLVTPLLGGTASAAATAAPAASLSPGSSGSSGSVDLAQLGSKISCASPTACLAVGTADDKSGDQSIPTAERLHGTTWKSIAVKLPKGAQATALTGVSCKSATYCLVVGGFTDKKDVTHPAAWTWNGTTLTLAAAPPLPPGLSLADLSAVSCLAVKSCLVFGTGFSLSSSFPLGSDTGTQLIWTWNGWGWARKTAKVAGTTAAVELSAARCFSQTSCQVSGVAVQIAGGSTPETPVIASWNGTGFTLHQAPVPAGSSFLLTGDLSCPAARSCVVVGDSIGTDVKTLATTSFAFAEAWNGTAWKVTKWTGPKGAVEALLLGVSCTSAASCLATGAAGSDKSGRAAALSYNGTKWSVTSVPSPGKGASSDFEGVSCPKAGDCVAIGEYGKSTGAAGQLLAGYWSGSAWRLKPA